MASTSNDILTTAEAAKILGVTPQTVTRWGRSGRLDGYRTYGRRKVPRESIEKFQRENAANSVRPAPAPAGGGGGA